MNDTAENSVLAAMQNFLECELKAQQESYRTRAERFRAEAAAAAESWGEFTQNFVEHTLTIRMNNPTVTIFREGMADIIRLRLRLAYMPLFQGLERIEKRCGILADLRREPWAHSKHPVNR